MMVLDNQDTQVVDNDLTQDEGVDEGVNETQEETQEHWLGELRDNESLSKFKDAQGLGKSYLELQKLVGMEKIALPKKPMEGATAEEIQAYEEQMGAVYGRLGRPEGADKYELDAEMAKELQIDEQALGKVKEIAYKKGMNNEQLKALVDTYGEIVRDQQQSFKEFQEKDLNDKMEGLKKEWGAAYTEKIHSARKAFNSLVGDNKALKDLFDAGLGNDPDVIKMFHDIGNQLSEDSIAGRGRPMTLTPDEAKRQIQEIKTDPKGPFWNDTHPEHEAMQTKVDGLYRLAYPDLAEEDKA